MTKTPVDLPQGKYLFPKSNAQDTGTHLADQTLSLEQDRSDHPQARKPLVPK